ncbi:unnamed protein product, partial [Onchocerca flexuosa]|uniref:VWFC domain-containing protein n=1 Tax=Onchocerca flexuosa TaxID=387005 RepID=A0A183HWZ9_9BILA
PEENDPERWIKKSSIDREVALPNTDKVVCTDNNYIVHVAGSSWRTDECISCKCVAIDDEAKIECFEEKCRQLTNCRGMPLTIKGRCCPVCSGTSNSVIFFLKNNKISFLKFFKLTY